MDQMDYIRIGKIIRNRRKQKRMTQEQLGELTDMSQKMISKIEINGTDSLWKLKRIAEVLEIPIQELIK